MIRDRRTQLHLFVTIMIMIFIFVQSALPADLSQQESNFIVRYLAQRLRMDEELLSFIVRKCAHSTEYMILGISVKVTADDLLCRSRRGDIQTRAAGILRPWCIGALYAVSDEIHQYFVPGRNCKLRDVIIDSCGVLTGVLIVRFIKRKRVSDEQKTAGQ